MKVPPSPPAGPRRSRDDFEALKRSLAIHAGLLIFIIIESIFFVTKRPPLVSTLRVDLVGLPNRNQQRPSADRSGSVQKPAEPKVAQKEPAPEPKEKPAPKTRPEPKTKPEPKPIAKKDEMAEIGHKADPKKKMKSALARIRALEKIHQAQSAAEKKTAHSGGEPIRGNFISKGNSLSGEAREGQAQYLELVRDQLQENWALPTWLSKADYSAQVRIFIDRSGRISRYSFVRGSGNVQFDEAVKRCISDSQQLPTPPDELRASVFVDGVTVGFPL